jgi:FlgD Ig-like domain
VRTIIISLAALVSIMAGTVPCAMAGWQLNGIPTGAPANNQFTPSVNPNGSGAVSILWREEEPGGSMVFGGGLTGHGESTWLIGMTGPTGTWYFPGPGTTASDGAGGEIAVWNVHSSGNWDIVAQRIDSNGNRLWGPDGAFVCAASGNQENPRLIADGAGGAICVWDDRRSDPSGDIYVQRMNASGSMLWTGDGVAACVDGSPQSLGSLLSDNAGGVVLAWDDARSPSVDIYVQRIDGSGNVLWAANGASFVTTSANEHFGQMVASGTNGAIITWVVATPAPLTFPPPWPPAPTDHYEVYTRRLDFGGSPDWPGSVLVCTADGSRFAKAAVSDGAGGTIIALYDNRYGNTDVFLARIDSFGNRVWSAGGVPLCTAAGEQLEPAMVGDGAGGAIVTWSDHRGGPAADIYAGHVDALGNPLWMADGLPVCTAAGNQSNPDIAPDGAGGVVIAWEDTRSGNSLVFAQRLNAATSEWGDSGLTGVGNTPAIPGLIVLQNYPNPFGSTTDLEIDLHEAAELSIDVYDVAGRRVNDLELGRVAAGWKRIPFAGRDHDGRPLASGVYFYRVKAAGQTITRKMVIAR